VKILITHLDLEILFCFWNRSGTVIPKTLKVRLYTTRSNLHYTDNLCSTDKYKQNSIYDSTKCFCKLHYILILVEPRQHFHQKSFCQTAIFTYKHFDISIR